LAKEWQGLIDKGVCQSRADLARRLGYSRARITQIMNLLKLPPQMLKIIEMLGDPMLVPSINERKIREIVNHSPEDQVNLLRQLLTDNFSEEGIEPSWDQVPGDFEYPVQ
jgi:hypothetical protein